MQTHHPLHSLAPRKAFLFLAVITSLALFLPSGKAAVIVSDDFSGAVNGTNINGRVTPVGGLTWTSGTGFSSSSIYNGGVTSDNTTPYGIFTVPFSVGTYTSFSMTAAVRPQGNNLNLVFTASPDAVQIQPATTIMAAINGFGGWAIFNGNSNITGGSALGNPTPYATAVLSYDVTTSTLTFTYDGVQLYQGVTSLTAGGAGGVASITRAGFSYNGITTNTTNPEFDSFSVAAVPEPQTWALAALGASAVLFRLRRKQRTA